MIKFSVIFFRVGVNGEVCEGEAVEAGKGVCVGMDRVMGEGEATESKVARPRMRKKDSRSISGIKNRI